MSFCGSLCPGDEVIRQSNSLLSKLLEFQMACLIISDKSVISRFRYENLSLFDDHIVIGACFNYIHILCGRAYAYGMCFK